jgi:hypothetical protein
VKTLACKLALLITVAAVVQLVFVPQWTKPSELERFESIVRMRPDVLLFSDSTNGWVDVGDNDRRSIAELLDAELPELTVAALDSGAWHAGVYEEFVQLMARRGDAPPVIVIPINLRSFSAEWDLRPQYQFDDLCFDIRHADAPWMRGLRSPLRILGLWQAGDWTQQDYLDSSVLHGRKSVGTVREFDHSDASTPTTEESRRTFILHYLAELAPGHRKVAALERIAELGSQAGARVVFYVTPIDRQTGDELLPNEFSQRIAANVATLRRSLEPSGARVLDLSGDLPATQFSWTQFPNEHLRDDGRRYVAARVGDAIEQRLATTESDRVLR